MCPCFKNNMGTQDRQLLSMNDTVDFQRTKSFVDDKGSLAREDKRRRTSLIVIGISCLWKGLRGKSETEEK